LVLRGFEEYQNVKKIQEKISGKNSTTFDKEHRKNILKVLFFMSYASLEKPYNKKTRE
jgi:hypothetical protein